MKSNATYNREYFNSYNIIEGLESKILEQINQLNPKSTRQKRGIINGLGSIIKCLTGNLDNEDAKNSIFRSINFKLIKINLKLF